MVLSGNQRDFFGEVLPCREAIVSRNFSFWGIPVSTITGFRWTRSSVCYMSDILRWIGLDLRLLKK